MRLSFLEYSILLQPWLQVFNWLVQTYKKVGVILEYKCKVQEVGGRGGVILEMTYWSYSLNTYFYNTGLGKQFPHITSQIWICHWIAHVGKPTKAHLIHVCMWLPCWNLQFWGILAHFCASYTAYLDSAPLNSPRNGVYYKYSQNAFRVLILWKMTLSIGGVCQTDAREFDILTNIICFS